MVRDSRSHNNVGAGNRAIRAGWGTGMSRSPVITILLLGASALPAWGQSAKDEKTIPAELTLPAPTPPPAAPDSAPTLFGTHCDHVFDSDDGGTCAPRNRFYVEADYLLLRPIRRDMDYAITSPSGAGAPIGTINSVELSTESGVRIGAGWLLPEECLDLACFYTYFHSNATSGARAPAGGTLFATMTHAGGIDQVETALATASLNYNVLDVELGRALTIGSNTSLRFFGGGRFAWIDQSMGAFYDGVDANHAFAGSSINFNGAGVRVGADGRLNLCRGFSAYARCAGSLLAGDFRTNRLETNAGGSIVNVDVGENFDKIVPVAEVGIGIGWEYRNFSIRAGYEFTNWFGLVDLPDFVDDVAPGKFVRRTSDLSLDGLIVQACLRF
jgi:hypothetical protein